MTGYLTPLPTEHLSGDNPARVASSILEKIAQAITDHPRSQQTTIGPSEIGTPCVRKLGYKLLGLPERERLPAWKPTIGTAVHAWIEGVLDADNVATAHRLAGQEAWYVETRVNVGDVDGRSIEGSADAFHRPTRSNWDWKIVGPAQLKKYRSAGPGSQYRVQAHLYGRGWHRAGIGCDSVNILFLPRNGELADAVHWSEPYDEQVALRALQRLEGVAITVKALGAAAPPVLPTADDYCVFCPFYKPGSNNPTVGCPGDQASATHRQPTPALTLI